MPPHIERRKLKRAVAFAAVLCRGNRAEPANQAWKWANRNNLGVAYHCHFPFPDVLCRVPAVYFVHMRPFRHVDVFYARPIGYVLHVSPEHGQANQKIPEHRAPPLIM